MCTQEADHPTITVRLAYKHHWKQFSPNMEMVAVKKPKYFCPIMAFEITGLVDDELYKIQISFKKTDGCRVAYKKKEWIWVRENRRDILADDGSHLKKRLTHSDNQKTGREWMAGGVSFEKLKLVAWRENSTAEQDHEHVFPLHTMYRHIPIITIISASGTRVEVPVALAQFIPVSIYANKQINAWKSPFNKWTTLKNGGLGTMKMKSSKDPMDPMIGGTASEVGPTPIYNSYVPTPTHVVWPDPQ